MSDAAQTVTPSNPFIQLWDDVVAEGKKDLAALETLAIDIGDEVVADIEDVFRVGAPLAVSAIIAEAPKVISGSEKFGNAVASVTQSLETSNLGTIVVADVQSLVQTAYTGLTKIASGA